MIGERLKTLYDKLIEKGLVSNKKDFSDALGIDYGSLSKYLTNKVNLSINNLNYSNYKKLGINIDWLLTGEGEMFQSEAPSAQRIPAELVSGGGEEGIPFYDIDVMAHIAESLDLNDEKPAGILSIPGFEDCVACFPVYGSSMEPKISSGDVIAVSKAVDCERILWGEIYLVITDAWRVVKTVHPGKTEEYIILRSINPDYAGDTNVDKKDLRALYLVRGVVSRLGM